MQILQAFFGEKTIFSFLFLSLCLGAFFLCKVHNYNAFCYVENFFAGIQIFNLNRVTDSAPVVSDDHIVKLSQLHGIGPEQLAHHALVLLQCQTMTIYIIISIRLIECIAPFQPAVIAAVPVIEAVEKALFELSSDAISSMLDSK